MVGDMHFGRSSVFTTSSSILQAITISTTKTDLAKDTRYEKSPHRAESDILSDQILFIFVPHRSTADVFDAA